ncbi:MAG: triose-phosphate isomerase [Firmicutes bacterium]|nr:triose-phosphate isomerase [Bacillota bacterium]
MRIPFIAGNWKMFKTKADASAFAEEFKALYRGTDVKAAICAPFTDLQTLVDAFAGTGIGVGAQNVHFADEGAYTGEISAAMLEEIGVDYCIVGHSERRQYFAETDETVNRKLKKLLAGPIRPIMCVGESLEQRDSGELFDFVRSQLVGGLDGISAEDMRRVVIAYEPIWAIGTGRTASPEQAEEMCAFIRQVLIELYDEDTADEVILQYGGSVKPANATEIMNMDEIDGALVGGASLKPADLMAIIDF